jgi:hypothetical protein
MKYCITCIVLFHFVSIAYSQTYFVSQSTGNDSNSGLSPEEAWKTTTRVNSANLGGGDTVLFKRGDKWTYQGGNYLRLRSGWESSWLVYSSYGEGHKPIISRSLVANDPEQWRDEGNNIWMLKGYVEGRDFNTAFVSYNHDSIIGVKKFSYTDMQSQGDFYTEERLPDPSKTWLVHNYTYVYSEGNPALIYDYVDVVVGQSGIAGENENDGVANIVISHIDFYQCGWNGIGIPRNSQNILIEHCDISYCGGQRHVSNDKPDARRGQCINTQGNIQNFEVRNCVVSQGWDGGIALQGWKGGLYIRDVWIHHNIIFKNEYGFETWGVETGSDIKDVYLENNTFLYNGYGWAHEQRYGHKKKGSGFFHWSYNGAAENVYIRNNIFYKDKAPSIYIWSAVNNKWKSAIICDNNLYFDGSPSDATEGEKAIWFADYNPTAEGNWNHPSEDPAQLYSADEYEQWKMVSGGFDENSIIEMEPLFKKIFPATSDSSGYDLSLETGSPAIGKGIYLEKYSNHSDLWGNKPGCKFNIGAFNGGVSITDSEPPVLEVQDITVSLGAEGSVQIVPEDIIVSVSDDCVIESMVLDSSSFDCSNLDTPVQVELTVTDRAGNSVSKMALIIIEDNIPPVFSLPENQEVFAGPSNVYLIQGDEFDPLESYDNCSYSLTNSITGSQTLNEVELPVGQNLIKWYAEDVSGNKDSAEFLIEVMEYDDTAPELSTRDFTLYLGTEGTATLNAADIILSASDNIEVIDTTISKELFTCSNVASPVEVTVSIKDLSGNSDSKLSLITVLDTISPILELPEGMTVNANSTNTHTVIGSALNPERVDDNCSFSFSNDFNSKSTLSGAVFSAGTTTITWTIVDNSGNSVSKSFDLTVNPFVNVEENSLKQDIKLFPNPAKDFLYLTGMEESSSEVEIVNTLGGTVFNQYYSATNATIDIGNFMKGIYFLTLRSSGQSTIFKVIVK